MLLVAARTPEALPGGPESSDVRASGSLAGHAYEKNSALAYCGSSFGELETKAPLAGSSTTAAARQPPPSAQHYRSQPRKRQLPQKMAPTRVMKNFETTKLAKAQRPKHRKGRPSKRNVVVKEVVAEFAGLLPYEKR